MEISERIAAIIKVNQHSAATFADAIGVQRSSISHILNGRNKPSLDLLEKIIRHFPRVDAAWLISGQAPRNKTQGAAGAGPASRPLGSEPIEPVAQAVSGVDPQLNAQAFAEGAAQFAEKGGKTIERIVVFYTDRTFATYEPN